MNERLQRMVLVAGVILSITAGARIENEMKKVRESLERSHASVTTTASSALHALPPSVRSGLDSLMLQIEIPRSAAEVTSLAPPLTRKAWRHAIGWDFLLIAGYVLLFVGLVVPGIESASLWERPSYCAAVAGAADVIENITLFMLLGYLDDGKRIAGTRVLMALPLISAAKWTLFFLAIRACAIQMEKIGRWRWVAVGLRAASTAGSWAAILSLLGFPARPLVHLMTILCTVLLIFAIVKRLRGVPHEPVQAEESMALM
jgi:hypothetical protein